MRKGLAGFAALAAGFFGGGFGGQFGEIFGMQGGAICEKKEKKELRLKLERIEQRFKSGLVTNQIS